MKQGYCVPLGRAKSVPNIEVSSFHSATCTENSSLEPDEIHVLLSQGCYSQISLYMYLYESFQASLAQERYTKKHSSFP
jgi:hypothetical protein